MAESTYLIRHPSSYLFRMVIPVDIQRKIGKKELRYSLKTGSVADAKPKARLIAGRLQQMFRHLRRNDHWMSELSEHQIDEIIRKYVQDATDEKEKDWVMNSRTYRQIREQIAGLCRFVI